MIVLKCLNSLGKEFRYFTRFPATQINIPNSVKNCTTRISGLFIECKMEASIEFKLKKKLIFMKIIVLLFVLIILRYYVYQRNFMNILSIQFHTYLLKQHIIRKLHSYKTEIIKFYIIIINFHATVESVSISYYHSNEPFSLIGYSSDIFPINQLI